MDLPTNVPLQVINTMSHAYIHGSNKYVAKCVTTLEK